MNTWTVGGALNETHVPPIEKFYGTLIGERISEEDYKHAQNVWETFQCKTLRDYHDLYLRTGVLLLADIFENIRNICMRKYELDPPHYYTSPGLSLDALLEKKTEVKLELLTDYYIFFVCRKRSERWYQPIIKLYAKANNFLIPNFNPTKPTSYLMYLDANNLYGWVMSQSLPTGNFRWLSTSNFNEDDYEAIKNIPQDFHTGCILEVDLEYPKELHNMHNDYPLAPESI